LMRSIFQIRSMAGGAQPVNYRAGTADAESEFFVRKSGGRACINRCMHYRWTTALVQQMPSLNFVFGKAGARRVSTGVCTTSERPVGHCLMKKRKNVCLGWFGNVRALLGGCSAGWDITGQSPGGPFRSWWWIRGKSYTASYIYTSINKRYLMVLVIRMKLVSMYFSNFSSINTYKSSGTNIYNMKQLFDIIKLDCRWKWKSHIRNIINYTNWSLWTTTKIETNTFLINRNFSSRTNKTTIWRDLLKKMTGQLTRYVFILYTTLGIL
jgi:hypothetical protein